MIPLLGSPVFSLLFPETVLLLAGAYILFAQVLRNGSTATLRSSFISGLAILTAIVWTVLCIRFPTDRAMVGLLSENPIEQTLKVVLFFSGLSCVPLVYRSREIIEREKEDTLAILLLSLVPVSVILASSNLLLSWMAMEVSAIGTYLLVGMRSIDRKSSEAAMKGFVYAVLSSIVLSLAMLLLYQACGSFELDVVQKTISESAKTNPPLFYTIFLLFSSALALRSGFFPFHQDRIDATDGGATAVASVVTTARLVAGISFALSVFLDFFSTHSSPTEWVEIGSTGWPTIVSVVSISGLMIGALAAASQTRVRRHLAFLSGGQFSLALIALSHPDSHSVAASCLHLISTLMSVSGALFIVEYTCNGEEISGLRGLAWKDPFAATLLSGFLLSLICMPPLVGFSSAVYILGSLVQNKMIWQTVAVLLGWLLSCAAIFPILRECFTPARTDASEWSWSAKIFALFCFAPVIFLGLDPDALYRLFVRSFEQMTHMF